jgi:hypothetical protein
MGEFVIRPTEAGYLVCLNTGHDLRFHGPFASVEEASADLKLWKSEWSRTDEIRRTYARATQKHWKLLRRRTPGRAAKIREELDGFKPAFPASPLLSAAWPPAPPPEPTAEAVRSWQVQARRAANRYRRQQAAKRRQPKATEKATLIKTATSADRTSCIRECWRLATDIPERRRAAHVARLTGVTSRYVRMVIGRT